MDKIVKILMSRDGMTKEEAVELIRDVRQMFEECEYDPVECEEIFYEEIGLEPEYMLAMLGF
ncbi:MAG: hypothetical protein ACLTWK_00275 [Eisenbergiella sp.]